MPVENASLDQVYRNEGGLEFQRNPNCRILLSFADVLFRSLEGIFGDLLQVMACIPVRVVQQLPFEIARWSLKNDLLVYRCAVEPAVFSVEEPEDPLTGCAAVPQFFSEVDQVPQYITTVHCYFLL